eukprot:539690_1
MTDKFYNKNNNINIMITTDLASRGIDIPLLDYVINYQIELEELPEMENMEKLLILYRMMNYHICVILKIRKMTNVLCYLCIKGVNKKRNRNMMMRCESKINICNENENEPPVKKRRINVNRSD